METGAAEGGSGLRAFAGFGLRASGFAEREVEAGVGWQVSWLRFLKF